MTGIYRFGCRCKPVFHPRACATIILDSELQHRALTSFLSSCTEQWWYQNTSRRLDHLDRLKMRGVICSRLAMQYYRTTVCLLQLPQPVANLGMPSITSSYKNKNKSCDSCSPAFLPTYRGSTPCRHKRSRKSQSNTIRATDGQVTTF